MVYAATSVAELEPPREPEPATLAPGGTGNWVGQLGGNWPLRDRDTWPLGVETWKFLVVLAGVGLALVVAGLAVNELPLEQTHDCHKAAEQKPDCQS